jgi:peptidyl-prolyl cis-trans isomerase SurA
MEFMIRNNRQLIIALVAVLLPLTLGGMAAAEMVDRIVAEVNNEIITMSELQNVTKTIEAQSGMKPRGPDEKKVQREMLEGLIDRKLAKTEAARRGIKITDKEMDEALARFKQRNNIPDDEAMAKGLSQAGLSLKEFKQQLTDQMTQERLMTMVVGSKVVVNDAEVRRLYDEKFKRGGNQVHLVTVRMPYPPGATSEQREATRQKAETLVNAVKGGESLTDVAKRFSLAPTDVGFISQSDLDPRLAEFLDRLKPKELAPVATPDGFQLIQLMGRRSGEPRPFEEVAQDLRRMLQQQEMEKYFGDWVKTLRDKAHIKIML